MAAPPTPNIDGIAAEGIRFTQFYATPLCTPTRASLMSGRCPVRYGLIYSITRPWSPYGLPADEPFLPQTLRDLGYQTAMVGKCHLGHAHRRMLPHARGFDHFYDCVNAGIGYFEHTRQGGLDWQRNGAGVREAGFSPICWPLKRRSSSANGGGRSRWFSMPPSMPCTHRCRRPPNCWRSTRTSSQRAGRRSPP